MRGLKRSKVVLCAGLAPLALMACGDDNRGVQQDEIVAASCNDQLNIAPLALDGTYCVLARIDDPDPTAEALAFDLTHLWEYASSKKPATSRYTLELTRHDLDMANNTVSRATSLVRMTVDPGSDVNLFAGAYVALTTGNTAAVGYTRSGDFDGEIYLGGGEGDGSPLRIDAPGNYDAVWLDADALLINGLGSADVANGQGVYVWDRGSAAGRKLISGLGESSSFVARGDSLVFVGASAWPDNKLYAFTVAELRAALDQERTLDAATDGDLVHLGKVGDIAALGDNLVVLESSFDEDFNTVFHAVRHIATSVEDGQVAVGERTTIVEAAEATMRPDALATSADMLALRLVDGDNPRTIAIVSRR